MLAKIVQRFLKKFRVKGDLFPNGDRRFVMNDAECQQIHNGNYRFDGSINGGINGVFGFSGDWGCFWGVILDFLPRSFWRGQARQDSDGLLAGIYCGGC